MRKIFTLVTPIVCLLALVGCATVPKTVYRPWNRTLSEQEIPVGAAISVSVETKSSPMLGSEELVEKRISEKATSLLQRRGFTISDNNPQFNLKITYETVPGVEEITSTSTYSGSSSAVYYRSTNWGVMLAQMISGAINQSAVKTQITSVKHEVYSHLIACELLNQSGHQVWKYDTRNSTANIDILDVYTPLLQIAFSSLPTSGEVIPRVDKLRQGRFEDYYSMYIQNRYFMCPALPNYIKTDERTAYDNYNSGLLGLKASDRSEKSWQNPTDRNLWKGAKLIGRYRLGSEKTHVNAVIDLKGTAESYIVSSARLVSDEEYARLQEQYDRWIGRLREYYDFFED